MLTNDVYSEPAVGVAPNKRAATRPPPSPNVDELVGNSFSHTLFV